MYGFYVFRGNGIDGMTARNQPTRTMKTYIKLHIPTAVIEDMQYQILEVITRESSVPVYDGKKLTGTRQTDELQTVRKLLGCGSTPLDAEIMATKNGYESWQSVR